MEKISRKEARAAGLKRYFTGKPCARGHVDERYVYRSKCAQCTRDDARRKYRNNLDHYRAKGRAESARRRAPDTEARAEKNRKARERYRAGGKRYVKTAEQKVRARETQRLRRATPEFRAKHSAQRNRAADAARCRAWRLANPGYMAKWFAENRDKANGYKRGRKIRKRTEIVVDLTKLQRGRCAYCRLLTAGNRHIDHIEPRKRGGGNARRNLQLACDTCNVRKSAKDPIAFAQELGRLL